MIKAEKSEDVYNFIITMLGEGGIILGGG